MEFNNQNVGVLERLQAPTPKFFRKIQAISTILTALGGFLLNANLDIAWIDQIAKIFTLLASMAAVMSQLPVDWTLFEVQKELSKGMVYSSKTKAFYKKTISNNG